MVNRIVLTAILVFGCLWCWLSVVAAETRAANPSIGVQIGRAELKVSSSQ